MVHHVLHVKSSLVRLELFGNPKTEHIRLTVVVGQSAHHTRACVKQVTIDSKQGSELQGAKHPSPTNWLGVLRTSLEIPSNSQNFHNIHLILLGCIHDTHDEALKTCNSKICLDKSFEGKSPKTTFEKTNPKNDHYIASGWPSPHHPFLACTHQIKLCKPHCTLYWTTSLSLSFWGFEAK